MTRVYANEPQTINETRAKALIGNKNANGQYMSGDKLITQYKTPFGLVTVESDTFGDEVGYSLLRYVD